MVRFVNEVIDLAVEQESTDINSSAPAITAATSATTATTTRTFSSSSFYPFIHSVVMLLCNWFR